MREQNRSAAKALNLLAAGHQNFDPSSPSSLISIINSTCSQFTTYRFWWVVLNSGSTDMTVATTRQVKGKDGYKSTSDVTYSANTIAVYWDSNSKQADAGIKSHIVKVPGAGTAKQKFLANSTKGCD